MSVLSTITKITAIALTPLALLAGAGCGGGAGSGAQGDYSAQGLIIPGSISASLSSFVSDDAMETYLKKSLKKETNANNNSLLTLETIASDTTPAPATNPVDSASAKSDYSSTNLQTNGVDEADLIKSDGQYLYIADNDNRPVIAGPIVVEPITTTKRIRVLELKADTPAVSEVAEITLAKNDLTINGLYLKTQKESGVGDILTAISGDRGGYASIWFDTRSWLQAQTELSIIDVSQPTSPVITSTININARLITSRRIGDKLYLITRYTPSIEGILPYQDTTTSDRLIDNAPLSELLPGYTINGGFRQSLVAAKDCYASSREDNSVSTPDIITITMIDLNSPESQSSKCFLGSTEAVYVSAQSIYLATTKYDYARQNVLAPNPGDVVIESLVYQGANVTTELHKFSILTNAPQYRGSGSVPGHLGWEEDKKSFRMGEYKGYLSILTSIGDLFNANASTLLTILRESDDPDGFRLKEISHLPNESRPERIGKPGEKLYGARFIGDKGYLDTFLLTDPLYILNLTNPSDPYIEGQLNVAGYSDYLLPIDNGLLLGLGKFAMPDSSSVGDGRGAWYQGIKLALFDLSDPANPIEADSIVIGKRGTYSDALSDHHAITYLPPADGRLARLTIPIDLHDEPCSIGPEYCSQPWAQYGWTHTGLYLFEIKNDSPGATIDQHGKIDVKDNSAGETPQVRGGNRSLISGDNVHFIYDSQVWSATWDDSSNVTGPQ